MMAIFSKSNLLPLFGVSLCLAIFWPIQVVQAAAATQDINNVSVEITPVAATPTTASQVQLRWDAVSPINVNGSISYDVEKSTDGGATFVSVPLGTAITVLTWVDNSVTNYTNVIYQVRSKEIDGGSTTNNTFSSPVKVFPPNINVHDNYMNNTNLCIKCHATHTAKAANLLNQPSAAALCVTCHDGGFTNSKYDVNGGNTMTKAGIKPSLGGPLNGEGSVHSMECTDCHGAHGTDSYRMLKSPTSVLAGAKADDQNTGETLVYTSGIDSFCLNCHTNTEPKYTTGVNHENTPLGMSCLNCHFSHGSPSDNLLKPGVVPLVAPLVAPLIVPVPVPSPEAEPQVVPVPAPEDVPQVVPVPAPEVVPEVVPVPTPEVVPEVSPPVVP